MVKSEVGKYTFDENGKLIFTRHKDNPNKDEIPEKICTTCNIEYIPIHKQRCRSCNTRYMRNYRKRSHKPIKHDGAYNFVIRDEETKELYKFSSIAGNPPEGYSVVIQAGIGELLPKIYHEEKSYHDKNKDD